MFRNRSKPIPNIEFLSYFVNSAVVFVRFVGWNSKGDREDVGIAEVL